ncbi:serine/threonine-protein kinase receptor [Elysia marginata]|uniref:Serine/threonine-protein kinase receptor n=1 Tax=Elysia marginata TaxID=1093978 RepID=A0AAV4J1M4_9GAST|nr:serine/threonine-protein kinase receptor [Elysia marginata]
MEVLIDSLITRLVPTWHTQQQVFMLICVLALVASLSWAKQHEGTNMCSHLRAGMEEPTIEHCGSRTSGSDQGVDPPHDYMTCFVSWMNSSDGVVMISTQGCWLNDETCRGKNECVATTSTEKHLFFCCCDGDMCNKNFRAEVGADSTYLPRRGVPPQHMEEGDTIVRRRENESLDEIILYTLGPTSAVVFMAIVGYFIYRHFKPRREHGHTQLPTADPSMTIMSNGHGYSGAIIPPRPALNLQLLELKAHGRYGSVWKGSLCDFLKGSVISWSDLCKIGESIACGLAYLHDEIPSTSSVKGKPAVAHRDLKSKNVLLKQDLTACIADFGLALKFEPGKGSNETHPQVGTRRYMAPEVLEGAICFNRDSFLRIDMYACGLILWELMTRCTAVDGPVSDYRLPFEAEVGQQPSLEDMQTRVVTRKMRPALNPLWNKHPGLCGLIPTVEECWDQDAEARLSAGCVQERIRQLARTVNSQQQTQLISDEAPPLLQQQQQQQHFLNNANNVNSTSAPVILTSTQIPQPPSSLSVVPPSLSPGYSPAVLDVSRDARMSGSHLNGQLEHNPGIIC